MAGGRRAAVAGAARAGAVGPCGDAAAPPRTGAPAPSGRPGEPVRPVRRGRAAGPASAPDPGAASATRSPQGWPGEVSLLSEAGAARHSDRMSTTRLLLLGAVRIFQPVHGYLLRRELLSWQVEDWAHVKPGSIYSGLRTLATRGLVEEVPGDPVSYRLTPDGEVEYRRLLDLALRQPEPGDPSRLLAGLCFVTTLPREEVREALRARALMLEASSSGTASALRTMAANRLAPASTAELFHVIGHWIDGERAWVRDVCARIDAGHYRFAGDEPGPDQPVDGVWPPAVLADGPPGKTA